VRIRDSGSWPLGERMRADGFAVQANVGQHLPDAARRFFRIFKESHPDVVHLHNPTPTVYASIAAEWLACRASCQPAIALWLRHAGLLWS